jgi:hypothetical protein
MLGFEIISLVSALFGVFVAWGRFSTGPAMALLCVMGAVAVGSVLGDLSTNSGNPVGGQVLYTYGKNGMFEIPITLFMVGRLAASGLLGICASWVVLERRPKESLPSLVRGVVCGVLLIVLLACVWKGRTYAAGLGSLVRTFGILGVGVASLGLLAAAVHFTIRAFEFGRLRDDGPAATG